MNKKTCGTIRVAGLIFLLMGLFVSMPNQKAEAVHITFAPGDLFVSSQDGLVEWRHPDGTLNQILFGTTPGPAEGMGFDAYGNLYVTHWCANANVTSACSVGNTVERFNTSGVSQGSVGSGYNCNPHAIVFDTAGNAYVGQADCTGNILKFELGKAAPTAFAVAPENRGSFWIELASDGCTMFYTSQGPNVKRFNVCTNQQLPDFNVAPLPGGQVQDLRILPDGGVLVASGTVIARLDATGALIQTYSVPGDPSFWAGLDLVGDGTFWAVNHVSSNVYRFDLTAGTVLSSFSTTAPANTLVDVAVKRASAPCP